MYKGYIFDLDGVIVHTDRYHFAAWKKLADEEGIYFDEKINDRLRGVSRMDSLDIVLERAQKSYTRSEKESMAERKNEAYRSYLLQMTPADVSEEVRDTLRRLKAAGAKLAIGSSSKNAGLILRRVELYDFFDAVADGNDITRSKPDPEVFLLAARRLGLAPEDCVVTEDARAGIEAALAGGFAAAAIGDARLHEGKTYSLNGLADLLTQNGGY